MSFGKIYCIMEQTGAWGDHRNVNAIPTFNDTCYCENQPEDELVCNWDFLYGLSGWTDNFDKYPGTVEVTEYGFVKLTAGDDYSSIMPEVFPTAVG